MIRLITPNKNTQTMRAEECVCPSERAGEMKRNFQMQHPLQSNKNICWREPV